MALSVTHAFHSAIPDGGNPALVQPSNWNAVHVLAATPGTILGTTAGGGGAVIEQPLSFAASGDAQLTGAVGYWRGAVGTTGQRPGAPTQGMERWNTTLAAMEAWNGVAWVQFATGAGSSQVSAPFEDAVGLGIDNTGAIDVTAAINALWAAHPALGFRGGTYKVSGAGVIVPSGCAIKGAGTGPNGAIFTSTTTNGPTVTLANGGTHMYASDFSVTHSGVPIAGGTGLALGAPGLAPNGVGESCIRNVYSHDNFNGFDCFQTDDTLLDWCWAVNNYNDGFSMLGTAGASYSCQYSTTHCLSEFNNGAGVTFFCPNACLNMIQGSPWIGFQTFANNSGGMIYGAVGTGHINGIALYSCINSNNNGQCLGIGTNGGRDCIVSGGLVELAGGVAGGIGRNAATPGTLAGAGIFVSDVNVELAISNVTIQTNSFDGILFATASAGSHPVISGCQILNNGFAAPGTTYSGIRGQAGAANSFTISNNIMADNGNQLHGVDAPAGSSAITLGNQVFGTAGAALQAAGAGIIPAIVGPGQNFNFGTGFP